MGTGSAGAGTLPLADRSIGEVVPLLDAGERQDLDPWRLRHRRIVAC